MVGSTWNFQELLSAVCFIPQNGKEVFFSKGKVPFSTTGYELEAVQESCSVKEIYRWKEDCFIHFMEKKTRRPREPSFSRKNQTKVVRKTEDDVPTIFTKEATPERGQKLAERVMCTNCRRSPWPHLSRTWSRRRWSSHWVQRVLNRGESVKSIEREGSSWSSWLRADAMHIQRSSPTYHR